MKLKSLLQIMLTEREVVRACAYCDLISPPILDKSKGRSHGMCKEHYFAYWVQKRNRSPEDALKEINKLRNEDFAPNTSGAKSTDTLPKEKQGF